MFSIYHSAFNLIKHGFVGWENSVKNSCRFADEVIIAVNTSTDETKEKIAECLSEFSNWRIIDTDFSYQDPWLDGKIKNEALQACTQDFKIQLDLDEYIPLWQKPLWQNLAMQIFSVTNYSALPITRSHVPVSPEYLLRWFGFSKEGMLFSQDTLGIFRAYSLETN